MKNNLIVILCFTAGIFCGTFANTTISTYCEKLPQFLLYALVIQVGLNLGANAELGKMVKDIRFSSLLLPFFTIIGTLVFSAAASLLLTSWNIYDCMAVGSGFAYYSLSSLLIVQLKEASAGIEIASQLGAIALLANIIREMLALFGAPLYASFFGKFAPVSVRESILWMFVFPLSAGIPERISYLWLLFTGLSSRSACRCLSRSFASRSRIYPQHPL